MEPPSESQIDYLNRLGVTELPSSKVLAAREICRLVDPLAESIHRIAPNFFDLGFQLEREAVVALRNSPQAAQIYRGESVPESEILAVIGTALDEECLRFITARAVQDDRLSGARFYIEGYLEHSWGLSLDEETVRQLAARSFARGFGHLLAPELHALEKKANEMVWTEDNDTQQAIYEKLFSRSNDLNRKLDLLLSSRGLQSARQKPKLGCLGLGTACAISGLLLQWLG